MKNFCLLIVALLLIKNASAQCGTIVTTENVTCNGLCDGNIVFSSFSGTSPWTLTVDGTSYLVVADTNVAGNCPGSHHWVLTDAIASCTDSGDVVITEPTVLIAYDSVFTNVTCNGLNNGSACATTNFGGTPPYSFLWTSGDTTQCTGGLPAGFYTVTVTDANGCTADTGYLVFEPTAISITINSIPPSCGQCDGYAGGIVNGGTPPYTYSWLPGGQVTQSISGFCSGSYTFTVADGNGCIGTANLSFPAQCDSVWPGDANLDGVANNNDILAIGIAYNDTGAVRPGASNAWTGQVCLNWVYEFASGTNYKHSDCDGNGIVNADDTLPVSLNYGLTHLRPPSHLYDAALPDLYLEAIVDTIGLSQHLFVKIHLGTSAAPVPAVYGMAFTLTFDQTLVDTTTASFDYSTSGLGTIGSDLISFQHSFYSAGAIDVAITRTNHADVINVDSLIGIFDVVITDNVSAVSLLRLDITNLTVITHDEIPLALNVTGDSVVVDPAFVGIPFIDPGNAMTVYPSPAKDHLNINSFIEIEKTELINELGETIFSRGMHQKNFSVDISGIKNGLYFLQLTTSSGLARKKVCVMK